jgi:hypothetical protein
MPSNPDIYNPIENVDGAFVPSPSVYQVEYNDISDPDAGRTEDGLMHKNRIGQKVKIQLAWNNVNDTVASTVLTAFDPEYVSVKYKDPKTNSFQTKTFYVGDRSAPAYNRTVGLWSNISFNIIEQ